MGCGAVDLPGGCWPLPLLLLLIPGECDPPAPGPSSLSPCLLFLVGVLEVLMMMMMMMLGAWGVCDGEPSKHPAGHCALSYP